MKQLKTFFATLFLFYLFPIVFISCTLIESSEDSSYLTFFISGEAVRSLSSNSHSSRSVTFDEEENTFITISLKGDFESEKTVKITQETEIIFSELPTGIEIWAEGLVYKTETDEDGITVTTELYRGTSSKIITKEGRNFLNLEMASVEKCLVSSITLDKSSVEIFQGESVTISVTEILPEDASDKSYTWSSSDESVATVSDGLVTAIADGSATITVTASDGSGVSAEVSVIVKEFAISSESATLYKYGANNSVTLSTNYTGDESISWSSSDTSIASVDGSGNVSYVSTGSATITASVEGLSATCEVTLVFGIGTPDRSSSVTGFTEASTSNPLYFSGLVTINGATSALTLSHSTAGSYDVLTLNDTQIYRGDWNVPNIIVSSGSGTETDPYVLAKDR